MIVGLLHLLSHAEGFRYLVSKSGARGGGLVGEAQLANSG